MILYAQGGMTVSRLIESHFHFLRNQRPHVVYIEIGTNDIAISTLSPATIAANIFQLADAVRRLGVQQVVVGQILWREDAGIPESVPDFNMRVLRVNSMLQQLFASTPGCTYWKHRGMWRSSHPLIGPDGVHLTRVGNHRLFRSIRGAVIHAVQRVQSDQ